MTDIDKTSPWKLIGSREVYRNPWMRVREDQVVRPDGKDGIYGVVEFANYALGVVAVDSNRDIVLVGQYRYTIDEYSWELPEGGASKSKPQLAEAQRELVEETGITAGAWIDLGRFHLSNSVTNEVGWVYLALDLHEGESSPDGDEALRTRRVSLNEAHAMCMDGRITDAVSIIGVTRAIDYLKRSES